MKLLWKLLLLMLALAALFILEFVFWGERFEFVFSQEKCIALFTDMRPHAWAIGILLLMGDLFLPIPATPVMAALGSVYGIPAGTLFGLIGSAGGGFLGYFLARRLGGRAVRHFATEAELSRWRDFFDRWGGWAVVASRMLPVLPEVIALLAGLARMRFTHFAAALLLGTLPTALLYASLGHLAREAPGTALIAALLAPVLLWLLVRPLFLGPPRDGGKKETSPPGRPS